jgi:tetratricopeptide (TPR) repeat protein
MPPREVRWEKIALRYLAVLCISDEIPEAVLHYAQFEQLGIAVQRIHSLEELDGQTHWEGVLIENDKAEKESFEMVRRLRVSEHHSSLPVLVLLPRVDNFVRAICFDMEYVLPVLFPLQSADFVPGLKRVIFFARKKHRMLELRSAIHLKIKERSFTEALELISEYAAQGNDLFRGHLLRARVQIQMGDAEAAIESAYEAARINRQSLEARQLLARAYLDTGDLDQAREVISKSLPMAPQYAPFQAMQARFLMHQGKWDAARERFLYALQLYSQGRDALHGLIAVELMLGMETEAVNKLPQAGFPLAKSIISFVQELVQVHRVKDAEHLFEQSVKLIPGQKELDKTWLLIAHQARRQKEWRCALNCFRAAALLNSGHEKDKLLAYVKEAESHLH